MKEQLSTAIDFYLETQKTNPFIMHMSSNASSRDLIQLRNCAFVLNKLTLLNLQHPKENVKGVSFEEQFLELYGANIETIINNPLMPFRDFYTVRDLVWRIQHFYFLLSKLTFIPTGEESDALRRKISINSFWPRLRAWMIAIEEKVPQNHPEIREYVTIRRGLLETDKRYFLSQMMAKKVQTKDLMDLISKYERQLQDRMDDNFHEQNDTGLIEKQNQLKTWGAVKKIVRLIPLTNELTDWRHLYQFLSSKQFKYLKESESQDIVQYVRDVLGTTLIDKIESENSNKVNISSESQSNSEENIAVETLQLTEIREKIDKILSHFQTK